MNDLLDPRNVPVVTADNREALLKDTSLFFRFLANAGNMLTFGSLLFVLPDGRKIRFDSDNQSDEMAVINVHNYVMARRILFGGIIGFYKSFADGDWDTPDLAQTLFVLAKNADDIQNVFLAHPVVRTINNFAHALNKNTKKQAQKNIMAHYDLGNAFYEKWLDPTMTYSSALFTSENQPLSEAQQAKYASLARQIELRPGESVLEIGSGWGGFAEFAAREIGANVTGLTISPEQHRYANERMYKQGLSDKVEIRLQDYRDVQGQFDKIASIEMFEAVGREYWPAYFSKVYESLKSDGRAGLQIITIADRFYENYVRGTDFIQRYVFPGGMLPSPTVFKTHVEEAGLKLTNTLSFGQDYARTLHKWHDRFLGVWADLQPMGFDDQFKKLWEFYLAYCEAGFRAETTDVKQVTLVTELINQDYLEIPLPVIALP